MSNSLQPHGLYPTRLLGPWDLPGKHTGVGCHFLLQGIFPTQGSNPGFPHYRQTLYRLSHREVQDWKGKHKVTLGVCVCVCVCVKSFQWCLTPYPMDCSPPGSSVQGILQARILEWVAITPSRESFQPRDWTPISYVSCVGRQVLYH